MALKEKETVGKKKPGRKPSVSLERVLELEKRIDELEKAVFRKAASINKVETFNGEREVPPREDTAIKMQESDKLQSIVNTIKILPPNLAVNGRHSNENVGAICGFKVTDDMLDKAYAMIGG